MNITLVFFVYGLAFFSMGLVMLLEADRTPILVERRFLIPLAIFGLVHGSHEWLEMFLERSNWLVVQNPIFWGWLRVIVLIISFCSLLIFGLQLLYPQEAFTGAHGLKWKLGLGLYVLGVMSIGAIGWVSHGDFIAHVDVAARYFLAVPGALIAGIALHREATRSPGLGLPDLEPALRAAAWGFSIYAMTQLIVPQVEMFPASMLNTASFQAHTGIPIQVVRAATAVLATIGLIRANHVTETERQRRFLSAQQARIEALEALEQETKQREVMRRELLRHIVLAQEDERARIARELHDETAQTLTAFTFHLAAMKNDLANTTNATKQLSHLQSLSRHMSEGIYRLVHDLRPAQLDDFGIIAALQYLCDETRVQMGLNVGLEIVGERRRIDPVAETVFYRIAQEALTNTKRHSGVDQAHMEMRFEPDRVIMTVSDQGCGFQPELMTESVWGLAGMRERAESVGGELQIQSSPGAGTQIKILLSDEPDFSMTDSERGRLQHGQD